MDASKMKTESYVTSTPGDDSSLEHSRHEDDNIDPSVPAKYRGTLADKQDMKVIGKQQVLRVCSSTILLESDEPDTSDSVTSSLWRCWVSHPPSWPVGKFCSRKSTGYIHELWDCS